MSIRLTVRILLVLAATAPAASAQTADDLFASGVVHDLRIFMNSRDLQLLHENFEDNTWYQADVEWRGMRVRSVAIRSRGDGSRNPTKPGLLVDIDRFVGGQRFLGLQAFVLDNFWQDPALIRESVTMALFARMGQPAPREGYARLFINDIYVGAYAIVEAVDAAFLARAFGDGGGYVFEYQWLDEFHGEYLGQSLDRYRERFSPETHTLDADSSLYAPLHDLFREINRPMSATWRESVERYLDVHGFLTHLAVERFVSEIDGVLGSWAMNNFYVYRPAGSTRHQLIPWDRDNAFQAVDSSVMLGINDNMFARRLLEHPDLRAFYLQELERVAGAASGWLDSEIVARSNVIRAAAQADTGKPRSNEEFEAGIAFLRAFAQQRAGFVLAEVARLK
jgi:spore coat protein CotH